MQSPLCEAAESTWHLSGLSGCATTRLNPLLFTMQDFVHAISCVLFPVLLGPVSAIHVNYPFPASLVTVDNWRLLPALATVVSVALEPGNWTLEEEFKVTPSSTSSGTLRINHPRQPGALCGLGGCATTRLKPLLFTMQDTKAAMRTSKLEPALVRGLEHASASAAPSHGPPCFQLSSPCYPLGALEILRRLLSYNLSDGMHRRDPMECAGDGAKLKHRKRRALCARTVFIVWI
ncbi:uncharacterized protein LOC142566357 [Dermacentor variabilis]|uniref:uncharacterized protein LOC142566357 n=1 Tax=Dermacentor variabilis TaxID=34621 RepID=UPI003F5BCD76